MAVRPRVQGRTLHEMDYSSLRPDHAPPPAQEPSRGPPLRLEAKWRHFAVFQIIFWGGFFLMRVLAAAELNAVYVSGYMAQRLVIACVYAAGTTLIHVAALRAAGWSAPKRLGLVMALCLLMLPFTHVLEANLTRLAAPDWPPVRFLDYLSSFGWVLLAWAGYYSALDHARETKRQALALARSQAAAHASQLKMLRYQLNPHFLFNSLNAISTLILEKRNADAEAMLLRLSSFLRHTIDTEPTQLSRLSDEIAIERTYLEMESVRFGDKLRYAFTVPEGLGDCLTPSLLLQPLIENAIKHGVAKTSCGGVITVSAARERERLVLSVENDGPPFEPHARGRGVGMRNTRERLKAIYGEDASIKPSAREGGGARVVVDLPWRVATSPATRATTEDA